MSFELSDKPKLAQRARLRLDRQTGDYVLLYPEKGLVLNPTSAAIAQRCNGVLTVREIVAELGQQFAEQDTERLEREVVEFLRALADRGLLGGAP